MELRKGQKILLEGDFLTVNFELNAPNLEIDIAAFLQEADGKVNNDKDFIFYGNQSPESGAIFLWKSGFAQIELAKIPKRIEKISFTATIYDADVRKQNFSEMDNANLKIIDPQNGVGINFPLPKFTVETAIVLGEIYRYKGAWKFNATGAGYSGGLAALCNDFGVGVENEKIASEVSAENTSMETDFKDQKIDEASIAKYTDDYSEKSFFTKAKNVLKKAGLNLIYEALQLFYLAQNPKCPKEIKAAILASLGLFISPLDFIPDIMPVVGFTDDGAAIAMCLVMAHGYIDKNIKKQAQNKLQSLFGENIISELKV